MPAIEDNGVAAAVALEFNDAGFQIPTDAEFAAFLSNSDIGTSVQAFSAVLAATTASFTTADETKLDGVEVNADVTDATNVASAGALMSSAASTVATSGDYNDLTNLPTLGTAASTDSTAYATAAQGSTADSALQSVSGISNVEEVTQAAYDALTPDANTLYVIVG